MKDIIGGNKLIAKFMNERTGKKNTTLPACMNYHSNWNSLMSARDEVMRLGVAVVIDRGCTVRADSVTFTVNKETSTQEFPSERTLVWEALVKFIKSYVPKVEATEFAPIATVEVKVEPATV